MSFKYLCIFLMTCSVIACQNNDQDVLRNIANFYKDVFTHQLVNKELPGLQERKEAILRNVTGSNDQQNVTVWKKCAQKDAAAIIDANITFLEKAARLVRKQLARNYNVIDLQMWWSQKLLQQAAEKVITEQPDLFQQLINSQKESAASKLAQQLVNDITTKFACGYGLEAGCKGMGLRRFLFGESFAYYLRGMKNRDPFERVDK